MNNYFTLNDVDYNFMLYILRKAKHRFQLDGQDVYFCEENRNRYLEYAKQADRAYDILHQSKQKAYQMEHTEYQVQIHCVNGTWQIAEDTVTTENLALAREMLARKRKESSQFTYRLAVRVAGDWCEALEVK